MPQFYNNAIFWVEVDKIKPNPFQPRKEFDEGKLNDLAKSIRQYGVIQPLTVSRVEVEKGDGGLATEYELIAGERRLRASKLAGLREVPVLIRAQFDDDKTKLEIAIIENLQREDLNAIDRAKAFAKLVDEFGFKHTQIAEKVGKSREYVSNTIRLLVLPQEIQDGLAEGKISEGHTRPLLMLTDRPEEQNTLYREIMQRRLTVRDSEAIARRIATDRVRKKEYLYSPDVLAMEKELTEVLGTRVAIETKETGGKLSIDFNNEDDLRTIFNTIAKHIEERAATSALAAVPAAPELLSEKSSEPLLQEAGQTFPQEVSEAAPSTSAEAFAQELAEASNPSNTAPLDDRSEQEKSVDENTFDPNSFSL